MKEQEGTHWTSRLLVWNRGALEAPEVEKPSRWGLCIAPLFHSFRSLGFSVKFRKTKKKIFNVAGKICIYSVSIKNI